MEEILSSIRRIIADEESEETKPAGEGGDLRSASTSYDEADDDADDVLELTKVVRDSGEVVDLNPPDHGGRAGGMPDLAVERGQPVRGAMPELAIEDDDEPFVEPEDEPEIELSDFDDEPEEIPAAQYQYHVSQEEPRAVSTKKAETDSLLSTGTASATTGAFAKLSKAFRPTPVEESIADGSGRTIEQFIEDMARPMLKEWLDEHMPAVVERLVQKEIQKIARRAELL
jgi:hypothetical protein